MIRDLAERGALAAFLMLTAGLACTQDYPGKPIRLVTSSPGGAADFVARLAAQELTASMGRQVVVDNRGSGIITGEIVSKAPPDGYTVLVVGPTL